ncbi:MAG: hypothetical protein GY757_08885 [bacterium]|nr:hypothetical protein [bacterium]
MKNSSDLKVCALLLVYLLILIFPGCSGPTEEDKIKEMIDKLGDSAEKKSKYRILSYISDNYSDPRERTYDDIEILLDENLEKYSGIAANILGIEISAIKVPYAKVEADVVLSAGALKMFRKMVKFSGQFYRFNMELEKEKEQWKIKSATWRHISLRELFPESMEVAKELFPNL